MRRDTGELLDTRERENKWALFCPPRRCHSSYLEKVCLFVPGDGVSSFPPP